jgi:serine/threonine protein kinase
VLKRLDELKNIPKLLYEQLDHDLPVSCIITSMVGRNVTKVDAATACNVVVDILGVLKDVHGRGYIHNDIHPGNIVNVDGKFRLIDFGLAVPRSDERKIAPPRNWPVGHLTFASHNFDKYLGAGDDLEALCYTVAFMYNRDKEYWRAADQDRYEASYQKKEKKLFYLFDGLPKVFLVFFDYVYDLNITATPDYERWQQRFQKVADDLRRPLRKHIHQPLLGCPSEDLDGDPH